MMQQSPEDLSVGVRSPYALTELIKQELIDWNKLSGEEQRDLIEATLGKCCSDLFSDPSLMDRIYDEYLAKESPVSSGFIDEPYTEGGEE
jgi:hypothetical protein